MMNKIIFIYFVFIAVVTNYWEIEAKSTTDFIPTKQCQFINYSGVEVCSTDGYDYSNRSHLECTQQEERRNLQSRHYTPCFIWERHGFETIILCFVSKLRIGIKFNKITF